MKKLLLLIICALFILTACGKKTASKRTDEVSVKTYDAEEKMILAINFEKDGNAREAIKIYRQLVSNDPYNVDALERLYKANLDEGLKLFENGEFDKAVDYLEIAHRYYKTEELRLKLVDNLLYLESNEKNIDKKISFLERVLKADDSNILALQKLGAVYEGFNVSKAVEIYEKIQRINPEDEANRLKLVRLYKEMGNNEEIAPMLESITNIDGVAISRTDFSFYLDKGIELYNTQDYENASKIFQILYNSDYEEQKNSKLLYYVVDTFYRTRKYADILEIYSIEKNKNLNLNDEITRFNVLMSCLFLSRPSDYTEIMKEFTENGLVFSAQRKIYLDFRFELVSGNKSRIDNIIEKVIETGDKNFISSVLNETAFYFAEKNNFNVTLSYLSIQKRYSDSPEIWFNEGIFFDRVQKFREALTSYRKAVEISPEDPKYRYYLILSLKRNRRFDEMDNEKNELIAKFPDSRWANYVKKIFGEQDLVGNVKMFSDAESYYNYGLDFARNGDFNGALVNFKMAHRLQPENFNILINIGNVFIATEKYAEALVYFTEAMNYAPNNAYIRFFIGKSYHMMNNYREAHRFYRESYELDMESVESKTGMDEVAQLLNMEEKENVFNSYRQIGIAAFNDEFYDIAYTFFRKAYDMKDDDVFTLSSLSHILIKKGMLDEAKKYVDKVIFLYPDEFDTNKLNYDFYIVSDKQKAFEILKNMNEKFGDDMWIYENLFELAVYFKNMVEAQNVVEKIKKAFPDDVETINRFINKIEEEFIN